jgi:hypothetical protein
MSVNKRRSQAASSSPNSFKSSAVKLGRTVPSISFSRNAASYRSRPRLRSQPPISMMASYSPLANDDRLGETTCLGRRAVMPVWSVVKGLPWRRPRNPQRFLRRMWSDKSGRLAVGHTGRGCRSEQRPGVGGGRKAGAQRSSFAGCEDGVAAGPRPRPSATSSGALPLRCCQKTAG